MSLTKKDRALIVEILRCVKDSGCLFTVWDSAAHVIGISVPSAVAHPIARAARDLKDRAYTLLNTYDYAYADRIYADACLEAAQMVEEGEWP